MFSKIICVLAIVCIVNASVLNINVFDDDPDTEVASNPKDCNFRACDQLCRRLKFRGGVCVNGRCKCDNFLNAEDEISANTLSDLEDLVSLKEDEPDAEVASNPKDCNFRACDQLCHRLKFRGGVCVNGRCKCDNFLNAEDTMNDLEESISLDDNFLSTEDEVSDGLSEDRSERGCNMQACDQLCRRLKFRGGACVNGRCKCDNFFGTEDEISETLLPVSELSEYQTERGCNMQACDQLCRRLKFRGGACVNGRCKCDNFFGTEDAVDEYSEVATRRICNLRQCNRTCTRRGYEGARCVNGWCNCHNKIQRQDSSLLSDVTSNENEESNIILRIIKAELIVPSPSACNTVTCNQMCHRLNYAGGWCRFGQCQCY